jgi:3-oxoadipate enol-lactonase
LEDKMAFIDIDGLRFNHRFDGESGPVLILGNSLGTNLSMWDAQVPAFSKRFRVLRYDQRGHGATELAKEPFGFDRLGRDVVALMDGLNIPKATYCGLSMGGMTGMWLGANAPERFEKLLLCNTSPHMPPPELWNQRIETATTKGMGVLVESVLARWFTAPFLQRSPELVEPVRQGLLKTAGAGYAACCAAIRDMDHRQMVARIPLPTLVISGAQDPATPPAAGQYLAQRISGARYLELDAAHLSNIEQTAAFNEAVLQFI